MAINISRLWPTHEETTSNPMDINILFKRPRVDCRISEYVFEFINLNILIPNRLMQKGDFRICLSMDILNPEIHKYFYNSPYNTDFSKFHPSMKTRASGGINYKDIFISCYSMLFSSEMKPEVYADIIYDMYGSFIVDKFKKITKEMMDNERKGLDMKNINQYNFPAPFINQEYTLDNSEISQTIHHNNGSIEKLDSINIKDAYIKKFGF